MELNQLELHCEVRNLLLKGEYKQNPHFTDKMTDKRITTLRGRSSLTSTGSVHSHFPAFSPRSEAGVAETAPGYFAHPVCTLSVTAYTGG